MTLQFLVLSPFYISLVLYNFQSLECQLPDTNVYDNGDGQDFVNVNAEDMLQQNPDIILRTSHAMSEEVMKNFETEFAQNDIWSKFSAVQNGKVYNLDNNYFGMSANFKWIL